MKTEFKINDVVVITQTGEIGLVTDVFDHYVRIKHNIWASPEWNYIADALFHASKGRLVKIGVL